MKNRKSEWRNYNLRDAWIITRFMGRMLVKITAFILKIGPGKISRESRRYPWLGGMLKNPKTVTNFIRGRSGNYLEAVLVVFEEITAGFLESLEGLFNHEDELVIHQVTLQPEILMGMGLKTWMAGFIPWMGTIVSPDLTEKYIDISENEGIPQDICSASRSTIGYTIEKHSPSAAAIVSSSMPCDAVSSQYTFIERKLEIPTFITDVPYNFYSEKSVDYYVGELKRMIAFLEENTPGRMDWDRLRKVCEKRNSIAELELELWDMIRHCPTPMAGEPIWISHLWFQIFRPGSDDTYRMYKRIVDLCKANLDKGIAAVPNERYRAVLWNAPMVDFADIFVWAEKRYGVSLIMDMLAYNKHPFIDTETPESMLRGLAEIGMQSIMARHTRGPYENYIDDLFSIYKQFNLDMIWVASSIGCKNTKGLLGILREKCREMNIPMLTIEHEIFDTRIVPKEDIMRQVDDFMTTIMKAEPLSQ